MKDERSTWKFDFSESNAEELIGHLKNDKGILGTVTARKGFIEDSIGDCIFTPAVYKSEKLNRDVIIKVTLLGKQNDKISSYKAVLAQILFYIEPLPGEEEEVPIPVICKFSMNHKKVAHPIECIYEIWLDMGE